MAGLALTAASVLFIVAAALLIRLAALLVVLVVRIAWLTALILTLPLRALVRLGRRDARFLALGVAVLAVPALAHAQPAQSRSWLFLGPHGGYAGRAVESADGSRVFLLGPSGGFRGEWDRGAGGQWFRTGKTGAFEGDVQQSPPASPQ